MRQELVHFGRVEGVGGRQSSQRAGVAQDRVALRQQFPIYTQSLRRGGKAGGSHVGKKKLAEKGGEICTHIYISAPEAARRGTVRHRVGVAATPPV